jgi:hypothetical protein
MTMFTTDFVPFVYFAYFVVHADWVVRRPETIEPEIDSPMNSDDSQGGARCPQRALARSLSRQRLEDKPLHLQFREVGEI